MREFSTIHTNFLITPAVQSLSCEARLLALYLMASPHTTMLGCFRLPKNYASEDLKLPVETISKGFHELSRLGFLTEDGQNGWVVIHDFLKWNPIQNPNQGQNIEKLFEQVPKNTSILNTLASILQFHTKHLSKPFLNRLETLAKAFRNKDTDTDTETDTETDTDTEGDTDTPFVAPARQCEEDLPLVQLVFDFWRSQLGHPQAHLDTKRKAHIRRALKSGYSPEQLMDAIRGCSVTPHNMGSNERGQCYDGLHIILKDADQIDRFIQNAKNPPRPRNRAHHLTESNLAACQSWLEDEENSDAIQ